MKAVDGHRSLRDQVTESLRAALIAGEMRPGVVYSAPALATQLGVSATPVREAMLELVKQGMVETVRNKGFRVREPSDEELDEITEIRELLEVPAIGKLADRKLADVDGLEKLRPLAVEIVRAAEKGDLISYIEADTSFHLGLLELAGNRHLVGLIGDLRSRSRLFGLRSLADRGVLVGSAQEHEELLDLLIAGDRRGSKALMSRHIGHIRGSWAGRPE